eukprot:NODE_855_length_3679_cov_0.601117.p1 type:complete len:649 gc:universal NODE_855_length_3679_cov_0.601117:3446-1500(-)
MNVLQKGSIVLDYIVEDKIGKGSFATVYKVSERKNPSVFYALKAVDVTSMNRKMLLNLDQEISIHKKLLHYNIVKLIASEKTPMSYNIILEFCLTDLSYFIKRKQYPISVLDIPNIIYQSNSGLDTTIVKLLLAQIAAALGFCRQFQIIHRDLKPQNILIHPFISILDEYPQLENQSLSINNRNISFKYLPMAKIADFGFAAITQDLSETICGSPLYMAPEILKYEKYDYKVDFWSVGIILYECLLNRVPWSANNHMELIKLMEKNPALSLSAVPLEYHSLLQSLLQIQPLKRLDFEAFQRHELILKSCLLLPFNMNDAPKQRSRVYHRRTSSSTSSFTRNSPLKFSEQIPITAYSSSLNNKLYMNSPSFKSTSLANYLSRKNSLTDLATTPPTTTYGLQVEDDFVMLDKESLEMDIRPLKRLSGLNLSYSPTSIHAFDHDLQQQSSHFELSESDLLVQAEECLNYAKKHIITTDDLEPGVNHVLDELKRKINRLLTIYELFLNPNNPAISFRIGCLASLMIIQDLNYMQKCAYTIKKHLKKLKSWHVQFLGMLEQQLEKLNSKAFESAEYLKEYSDCLFKTSIEYLKKNQYKQSLHILELMLLYPDPVSILLHLELQSSVKQYFKEYETSIIDVMTIVNKRLQQLQF